MELSTMLMMRVYYAALNVCRCNQLCLGEVQAFQTPITTLFKWHKIKESIIVASAGNSNQNLASNPRYPSLL